MDGFPKFRNYRKHYILVMYMQNIISYHVTVMWTVKSGDPF